MPLASVVLKPGRDKSVRRRHPWVFSGAIQRVDGRPAPGETVAVRAADQTELARGAYSPRSQIRVRLWTFTLPGEIDAAFFRARLQEAVSARDPSLTTARDAACRLVNGEADGLPGLVVDRYGGFLVCQFLAAGTEYWKEAIVGALQAMGDWEGIYERSDADVRTKEGLVKRAGPLAGREPPDLLTIREGSCRFLVNLKEGHKTGFYLDQRENRALVAAHTAGGRILNAFSYTGGFAVAALRGGARHVTSVDTSRDALAVARQNLALNGIDPDKALWLDRDVFDLLREYRAAGRTFDMVVLDPPKFAESRGHLEKALRGYKDINLLALQLLAPGGLLITFSCSGLVDRDQFQKAVAYAALDAGRPARILRWLSQSADHPASLSFPESAYLKGLMVRAG